jgi:protein associated with RNAse G/E
LAVTHERFLAALNEYMYHSRIMKYPKELDKILKYELSSLIDMEQSGEGPFNKKNIDTYYDKYLELKKQENQEI